LHQSRRLHVLSSKAAFASSQRKRDGRSSIRGTLH
jgi:hypothetical protein